MMDYLKLTTAQILKKRFKSVQNELKTAKCIKLNDFRTFVLEKEPEYDCPAGYDKIQNAWYGRTPDLRLTELIQDYKTYLI